MNSTAAIILAAGNSSRLGQPKQLLQWKGRSLLQRAVGCAREAGCSPVVVVVGSAAVRMAEDLEGSNALLCQNPNWSLGLGTSVKAGVQALQGTSVRGAILMVCDQVYVNGDFLQKLMGAAESENKAAAAACYAGQPGVPAWVSSSLFPGLLSLPDQAGAKGFLIGLGHDLILQPFAEGLIDIDTLADWKRLSETASG